MEKFLAESKRVFAMADNKKVYQGIALALAGAFGLYFISRGRRSRTVGEKYELGAEILDGGKAGQFKVYAARLLTDPKGHNMYVVKEFPKGDAEAFEMEVSVLKALAGQPGIVQFEETAEDDSNFYIVTKVVVGDSVDTFASQIANKSEQDVANLIRQMLKILVSLQNNGIAHRDLKPSRFVVDEGGNVTLKDLGKALMVKEGDVYPEMVAASVKYIAPELADTESERTGAVLKQADVWSVGVMAYLLVIGKLPFEGDNNKEIVASLCNDPVDFPAEANLTSAFEDFVSRVLEKLGSDRLSPRQALKHSWVNGGDASGETIDVSCIELLKQFTEQSDFKKRMCKILASQYKEERSSSIHKVFKEIDVKDTGRMDMYDLVKIFQSKHGMGEIAARKKAKQMMECGDTTGNGWVTLSEFHTVYERYLLSTDTDHIREIFTLMDKNNMGKIDRHMLKKFLGIGNAEVQKILDECDTNEDGMIDFEEFTAVMKEENLNTKFRDRQHSAILQRDLFAGKVSKTTTPGGQ